MSYKHIKEYRKRFKKKIVNMMGGECMLCGYNKCIKALELHHTDPHGKDFCISQMTTLKWSKIFEEAQKCVMVCANCHREIHDNLKECPKLKVIKFSTLSDCWVDWNYIDLASKVKTMTVSEISKEYKIKKANIYRKCKELGLEIIFDTKLKISKEILEKLIIDKPLKVIGEMFNVTDNAIKKRCIKLGIPLPNNGRGYWSKKLKKD
jgi:hypothetical protein